MNTEKRIEHCMVCGSALHYLQVAESLTCAYCGANEYGHVKCERGHFVCEACHCRDAMTMIEEIVLTTHLKDPAGIAELMMSHPGLPMLGCEHAFIAAGALMAALRNSPYSAGKIASAEIQEVFQRTKKQAISGYCGLTGVCGIAPALGACISSYLGARCGSDAEQKITMEAVIRIMQAIADLTGPSCCKAYVRNALRVAVAVLGERFGILLPLHEPSIACSHATKHPHGCREEKCPFYQKLSGEIGADSIHLPVAACQS